MAEQTIDLYGLLGITKDATDKEIKAGYRDASKVYHPDVNKEANANEVFKKIKVAYDVLIDPKSRKKYDEDVEREKEKEKHRNTIRDFEELCNAFAKKTGVHTPITGEDVEMPIYFHPEEIRQGATKTITFERFVNCDTCEGHRFLRSKADVCTTCKGHGYSLNDVVTPFGTIKTQKECGTCNGNGYTHRTSCEDCKEKGKVPREVKVQFELPADTNNGVRLKLAQRGDSGINGGENGDLIITLKLDPKSKYQINEFDLWTNVDVCFEQLGQTITVSCPSGNQVDFPIPVDAQDGHTIIVENEGLLNPKTNQYGSLYIKLKIGAPTGLNKNKFARILEIIKG